MAHWAHWNDEESSVHRNSPAGVTPKTSEVWSDARSPPIIGESSATTPDHPDVETLARPKQGLASQLIGRLYSGAEQSQVIQFARQPHLLPAYKTLRPKNDKRVPVHQIDAPAQMAQHRTPLPAIGEGRSGIANAGTGKSKSAVDEIYRLRSKLGWKTIPSQAGSEEADPCKKLASPSKSGTKKAEDLMKKVVQVCRARDDGEFVNCLLRNDPRSRDVVYNPYDMRVVSSTEAKKAGMYYTVSASAVTQVLLQDDC